MTGRQRGGDAPKVDLRRSVPGYRAKAGEFDVVELQPQRYLMLDGEGDPNTAAAYADALAALYPLAYAVKFASKRAGRDYTVPPLEALWWADDLAAFTSARDKSKWRWTVMLLVPEWITAATVEDARAAALAKGKPSLVARVRFEALDEGSCVQTLHLGSYDDEAPVLARMHDEIIPGLGCLMRGRHHEIYLSDARRVAPERLRTILRQPVASRAASALPESSRHGTSRLYPESDNPPTTS